MTCSSFYRAFKLLESIRFIIAVLFNDMVNLIRKLKRLVPFLKRKRQMCKT